MADLHKLVEELSKLTVLEAAELSKLLEEKWGVSAAAPVAVIAEVVPDAAPVEVQTEFTVTLTAVDPAKKIVVIKEVRTITGLGLKEAKEFTENTPKMIKESLTKDEADKIKEKLEAAGGTVVIS
jgi:large subunit ribosomal protein L7/L12